MKYSRLIASFVAALCTNSIAPASAADSLGHVTGLGGVFVVGSNPKALSHWYRDVLGVPLQSWGGVQFKPDAPGHPPYVLWSAFPKSAVEFKQTKRDFFLTFTVDDLDALIARLTLKHVAILKRESDPYGRYATILDPDGTRIELWQPLKKSP